MIVTVTMNPAIDKTMEVDTLKLGGLNQIKKAEADAGGKGINVSKTIRALGGESIATGFLGGNSGKMIQNVLEKYQIRQDFVWVDGETRTNTKVLEISGEVTELNEPGPEITETQVEALLKKLEMYAEEDTLFVLAGSIPGGVSKEIYANIIRMAHAHHAQVLLDADGELFRNSVKAMPDIMKPNHKELEAYVGIGADLSQEQIKEIAKSLVEKGIPTVAVSMGKEGAIFVNKNGVVRCPALKVNAHSTVGAGDAMVAALAYAWDKQLGEEETVRLCMAASAGAVTTVGTKPPTKELVELLKGQVVIETQKQKK